MPYTIKILRNEQNKFIGMELPSKNAELNELYTTLRENILLIIHAHETLKPTTWARSLAALSSRVTGIESDGQQRDKAFRDLISLADQNPNCAIRLRLLVSRCNEILLPDSNSVDLGAPLAKVLLDAFQIPREVIAERFAKHPDVVTFLKTNAVSESTRTEHEPTSLAQLALLEHYDPNTTTLALKHVTRELYRDFINRAIETQVGPVEEELKALAVLEAAQEEKRKAEEQARAAARDAEEKARLTAEETESHQEEVSQESQPASSSSASAIHATLAASTPQTPPTPPSIIVITDATGSSSEAPAAASSASASASDGNVVPISSASIFKPTSTATPATAANGGATSAATSHPSGKQRKR